MEYSLPTTGLTSILLENKTLIRNVLWSMPLPMNSANQEKLEILPRLLCVETTRLNSAILQVPGQ